MRLYIILIILLLNKYSYQVHNFHYSKDIYEYYVNEDIEPESPSYSPPAPYQINLNSELPYGLEILKNGTIYGKTILTGHYKVSIEALFYFNESESIVINYYIYNNASECTYPIYDVTLFVYEEIAITPICGYIKNFYYTTVPRGLAYNISNGAIYGTPKEAKEVTSYAFYFADHVKSYQYSLVITVKEEGEKYVNGVFIKIIPFTMCSVPTENYFIDDNLISTLKYSKLDFYNGSEPYHDLMFPQKLKRDYAMYITGKIHIPRNGTYYFKFEGTDGISFCIGGVQIFSRSACSSYGTIFSNKVLQAGELTYTMISTQLTISRILKISWKFSSSDEYSILDEKVLHYVPSFVTDSHYIFKSLVFPINVDMEYIPVIIGYWGSFEKYDCPIPNEIKLNELYGVIPGKATVSPLSLDCTIRVKGINSKLINIAVNTIDYQPTIEGLLVKYYISKNFDANDRTLDNNNIFKLVSEFYINNISYNGDTPHWYGFNSYYPTPFSASFDGYFDIEDSWIYCIYCNASNICHIEIDDNLVVSKTNSGVLEAYSCNYFLAGKHKIHVVGHQYVNNSVLIVSIGRGYNIKEKHILTGFYNYPTEIIHYEYIYSTITSGVPYLNTPWFYNSDKYNPVYQIKGNLPTGLTFYSNGTISGIITLNTFPESEYTIVVTFSRRTYYTHIKLVVVSIQPPKKLEYDRLIMVMLGSKIDDVIPTKEGYFENFYTVPKLPDGLNINKKTGIISGRSYELFNGNVLVYGENGGGSLMSKIFINVFNCSHPTVSVYYRFGSNNRQVLITTVGDTILNIIDGTGLSDKLLLCSDLSTIYDISVSSYGDDKPFVEIVYSPNIIYYSNYTCVTSTITQLRVPALNTPPELISFPDILNLTAYDTYTIYPVVKGSYINCTIAPSLPNGLLSDRSCTIKGTPEKSYTGSHTAVLCNNLGCVNTAFSILINSCQIGNDVIELEIYTNDKAQVLRILDDTGRIVYILNGLVNTTYKEKLCIKRGNYTLNVGTSSSSSWAKGSYLYLRSLSGMPLYYSQETISLSPKYYYVSTDFFINSDTQLYFSDSYDFYWNYINYDDSKWSNTIPEDLPVFSGITRYYRYKFNINSSIYYSSSAFVLSIPYTAGIGIYFNEIKIYQDSIPDKYIHYTPGYLHEKSYFVYSGPILSLLSNNVIAIEIHRNDTTIEDDDFYFSLNIPNEKCGSYINYFPFTLTSNLTEDMSYLYDNRIDTNFAVSYITDFQLEIYLNFPAHYLIFINKYTFISSSSSSSSDPYAWNFYGTNDGKSWVLLDNRTDIEFRNRRQSIDFELDMDVSSYNKYKWVFTGVKSTESGLKSFSLSELQIGSCYNPSCKRTDTLPETSIGGNYSIPCAAEYVGFIYYYCIYDENTKQPKWSDADNQCHLEPPTSLTVVPDNVHGYAGYLVVDIYVFKYGYLTETTISPELPSTINFDGSKISGRFYEAIDQIYTISLCNEAGCLNKTLTIIVIEPYCEAQLPDYPSIKSGETAIINCGSGFIGEITRTCLFDETPIWGDEVYNCRKENEDNTDTVIIIVSIAVPVAIIVILLFVYYIFIPRTFGRQRVRSRSKSKLGQSRSKFTNNGVNLSEYGFI